MYMTFDLPKFVRTKILKREQSLVQADSARFGGALEAAVKDRNVLVLGGGGTIGASFIKTMLPYRPARIVAVDLSENALTELVRDVRSTPDLFVPEILTYPLGFADPMLWEIYEKGGPFDIVANFAAHKHVRSEKDGFSIRALLQNNFLAAHDLMERLSLQPPSRFFCVSTDKAANPVNVMGASKWLMEQLVRYFSPRMRCTTSRFANVAFSNGSLLDGHLKRLQKKQPLSLPADVRRYFVSCEEAGEICLLSCVLGESGDIFFPKLAPESMRSFRDVTVELLEELGLELDECSSEQEAKEKSKRWSPGDGRYPAHVFASDTSGEKELEEYYTADETIDLETYESLGVVKGGASEADLPLLRSELESCFRAGGAHKSEIIAILERHIPTFSHRETGRNLDQKM